MPEELYWFWFCSIPGLTWKTQRVLLHYFGSPKQIFDAPVPEFDPFFRTGLSWITNVKTARDPAFLEKKKREAEALQVQFVSCMHPLFPSKLKELPDCPHGLFYKGSLPDNSLPCFGIVGSRACTSYGKQTASVLSEMLSLAGFGVVSGMAAGVDSAAGRGAISSGGKSWAVMGCGADVCYPAGNRPLYESLIGSGGIISEYPCHTRPARHLFPPRNRLISGLSDTVIIVEARKKSGSLITADYALDQGREVLVVPGRCDDPVSQGCNQLIAQGAEIIPDLESFQRKILERTEKNGRKDTPIMPSSAAVMLPAKGSHEERVLSVLESMPRTAQEISLACSLPIRDTSAALTSLVLSGLAGEVGRGAFIRVLHSQDVSVRSTRT